jgi:hypothetical protein
MRARAQGSSVTIRAISPQYGRSTGSVDWYDLLFLNRNPVSSRGAAILTITEYEEWPDFELALDGVTLIEANALFNHFSGLSRSIADEVDQFCHEHWHSEQVLGVHYRGTDKFLEAPPVSLEEMISLVKKTAALWPELKIIFVATDESGFIPALRAALTTHHIVSVEGTLRSENGQPVHRLPGVDGQRRAREAVVDCVILSRTSLLLKSASMLSGWAAVLNPALPTVLVNPPYADRNFFPDSLLPSRMSDLPALVASIREKADMRVSGEKGFVPIQ